MMPTADELIGKIRSKYPEYRDLSDSELASRVYNRYPQAYPELKGYRERATALARSQGPSAPTATAPGKKQPIRMGLAGTGRGSEQLERPDPLEEQFKKQRSAQAKKRLAPSHKTPQEEAAEMPGAGGVAARMGIGLLETVGLGGKPSEAIEPGRLLGKALLPFAPEAILPRSLAGAAGATAIGEAFMAPETIRAIRNRDFGALAASVGIGAIPLAGKAVRRLVKGKETSGATVQEEQVKGAATPDVRAGEGRQVGEGRSRGQGPRQQGKPPTGARPQAQAKGQAQEVNVPSSEQSPRRTSLQKEYKYLRNRTTGEIIRATENSPGASFISPEKGPLGAYRGGKDDAEYELVWRSTRKPAAWDRTAQAKGQEAPKVGEKYTGVRHATNVRRAEEGLQGEVPRGKGTAPKALVEQGQAAYKKKGPEAAEKRMAYLESHPSVGATPADIGFLRAHHEALSRATDAAEQEMRANPNDPALKAAHEAAFNTETAFARRFKTLATSAGESMRGLQGEVSVSEGEFAKNPVSHIRRYFESMSDDKPMTPEQEAHAKQQAQRIEELQSKLDSSVAEVDRLMKERTTTATPKARTPKMTPEQWQQHFRKRIDDGSLFGSRARNRQSGAVRGSQQPQFTPEEIRAIWEHAKTQYIDPAADGKRFIDFDDTVNGTARDLGLQPDWVRKVFSENKTVKTVTNEMYNRMSVRRGMIRQAKSWAQTENSPKMARFLVSLYRLPFAEKVFGHGTVLMETHAGPGLYQPTTWPEYFRNFKRQFTFIAHPQLHEQVFADMIRDPEYTDAVRNKLAIDPSQTYDNYQDYTSWLGRFGARMNLGLDALKVYRFERYKQSLQGFSEKELASDPFLKQQIAAYTNHITGTTGKPTGGSQFNVLFAPRLFAARWQRYADALKPFGTALNWRNATDAQKSMAVWTAKRTAELGATYVASLAANNAMLAATGQKERVNWNDPMKSDWMHYKWGDRTFDPSGGMLMPLRFVLRESMLATGRAPTPTIRGQKQTKQEAVWNQVLQYFRGAVHPAIQFGSELASQEAWMGRPLPFSSEAGDKQHPKYTWAEYGASELPIPLAGVAQDFYTRMRNQGVNKKDAMDVMKALAVSSETLPWELTGTRVGAPSKPRSAQLGRVRKIRVPSLVGPKELKGPSFAMP